jgi:hypothetical protein
MAEFEFSDEEFRTATLELVPSFQRNQVLAGLNLIEPSDADFDAIGTGLTGEQMSSAFLFFTGAPGKSEKSIWAAIKTEVFDFICTNSKKYAVERKDGAATIKNVVTILATALASSFNLALGVVVGAVTVALMSAVKIGKNAWCEINRPSNG